MGSKEDLRYASKASCAIRRPGRGEGPCFGTQQPGGGRLPIFSLVPVYPLRSVLIPVPWYQCSGSGGYKAAGRSRPPGLCHARARWRPLRSYGRDTGRRAGDSFVVSPGHLVNDFSRIAAAGGPPDGAAGARPLCVTITATGAGGPVDGATGASPLCATGWVTAREALRMAPQVPVPPCHFLPPAPGLVVVT